MSNEIKRLLKEHNLKPKKYLGQNFLIDKTTLGIIINAAELARDDVVLEIGPGLGILTKELAKKVKRVVAVEKDKRLVKILKKRLSCLANIKIIEGDVLKLTTENLKLKANYKVVANLPYYITSPVIRKFLEEKRVPKLMVLMVQKEVAKRICAKPPKMSVLSVAVQFYSFPKIVKIVKKECFWPKPKVDSAIVKLTTYNQKLTTINTNLFFKIVKAGFSHPRKQLKNNLKKVLKEKTGKILQRSNIKGVRRAETLSVNEWVKICLNLKN